MIDDDPSPLERPLMRDPVLHETLSAIMWVSHAISCVVDGRPDLARHMLDLARETVFKAAQLADGVADPAGPPVGRPRKKL